MSDKLNIAELLFAARNERINDPLVQQLADMLEDYGRRITAVGYAPDYCLDAIFNRTIPFTYKAYGQNVLRWAMERAQREAHEAVLRRQREAEEAKLAEQRAEIARAQAEIDKQREEAARIERERLAAIEREEQRKREAEEAAARAEAARIEAERRAAEQEQIRRERVQFELNGPGEAEIVRALAEHYEVEEETALRWVLDFDLESLNPVGKAA